MTPMTRRQIRHLADEIERMDREHGSGNHPAAGAARAIRQLLREVEALQQEGALLKKVLADALQARVDGDSEAGA